MEISSKEIILYCFNKNSNLFLILISNLQGWGLVQLKYKFFIIKANKLFIYNLLALIKSYISFLINFFLGFFKNYFQYLKIKGMGFKIILVGLNLLLKLGFSHRIIYICMNNWRFQYLNKQLLKINSRCFFTIKNFVYSFQKIRKLNSYKKKGIFIKGSIIKIKVSSKKAKV